jgi:linoleoyl-CoA desaturase
MSYLWGKLSGLATVQFSQPKGDFFKTLRTSVNGYFTENNIKPTGNAKLYWKTAIIITTYIATYTAIVAAPIPGWSVLVLAGFLGFVQGLVGFNIMHDACHDSFSTKKAVNHFFGLSMNALGTDAHMWRQKHNIVHHTYTNVDGIDDDIAKTPFLRMSETQKRFKAHRFQHIYLTFLYGISTLYWITLKDWESYFNRKEFNVEVNRMKPVDHIMFWTTKTIYFGLYFVIPGFIFGFGWAFLGFTVMHFVLGCMMSFVFQLAHVVENVEFEHSHGEHTEIDTEWAVHQINTTSDFAVNNKVVSWIVGGLNYQVEHHLFPRISHIHYPAIQKIVSEVCAEFDVEYRSYPTTGKAIASHFRHMKRLGNKDVLQPQFQPKQEKAQVAEVVVEEELELVD